MTIGHRYICSKWYTAALSYDSLISWCRWRFKKYDAFPSSAQFNCNPLQKQTQPYHGATMSWRNPIRFSHHESHGRKLIFALCPVGSIDHIQPEVHNDFRIWGPIMEDMALNNNNPTSGNVETPCGSCTPFSRVQRTITLKSLFIPIFHPLQVDRS